MKPNTEVLRELAGEAENDEVEDVAEETANLFDAVLTELRGHAGAIEKLVEQGASDKAEREAAKPAPFGGEPDECDGCGAHGQPLEQIEYDLMLLCPECCAKLDAPSPEQQEQDVADLVKESEGEPEDFDRDAAVSEQYTEATEEPERITLGAATYTRDANVWISRNGIFYDHGPMAQALNTISAQRKVIDDWTERLEQRYKTEELMQHERAVWRADLEAEKRRASRAEPCDCEHCNETSSMVHRQFHEQMLEAERKRTDRLNADLEQSIADLDEASTQRDNLLARIFRDGGQHMDSLPNRQAACDEADELVATYIGERDEALTKLAEEQLQHRATSADLAWGMKDGREAKEGEDGDSV